MNTYDTNAKFIIRRKLKKNIFFFLN